jgi:hypothetical protein
VRRGVRWALGLGAMLVAVATASAAWADIVPIDLDECSPSCVSRTNSADGVTMVLPGGGRAGDPSGLRPDLVFDPDKLPSFLVEGPPSAIATVEAGVFDDLDVSPYAFFETIIEVPHSADAPALAAVRLTRSFTSRLSSLLWASNDFFGPPPGDVASRRGLAVSVDTDAMISRLWKPALPTLSRPPLSESPSSGAAQPFSQFGNEAGSSGQFSSDGAGSRK